MKKITFLFLLIVLSVNAQNDCKDAIVVCGNSGYDNLEVKGAGINEISNANSCNSGENNSIWLKLYIKTGGTLGFKLIPTSNSINEDFDFFIFGPNATCSSLGRSIRCSTTNPAAAGSSNNTTGMNGTETDTFEGPGPNGNNFVKWLTVQSGETYFLIVDRPIGNSNFKLEWTGTAKFSAPPIIDKSITATNTLDIKKCDDDGKNDGKTSFNLTVNDVIINNQPNVKITYHTNNNDAILGINPITNPTNFVNTTNPQTVYIRLSNTTSKCFSLADFKLTSKIRPEFDVISPQYICVDTPLLILKTINPKGSYSYKWVKENNSAILGTSSTLNVTSAGKYTVTATDNESNCSLTKTITVNAIITPIIKAENIVKSDETPNKSIKIIGDLATANYEYALSNDKGLFIDYQDNQMFNNLSGGLYTIKVKNKKGCGISEFKIALLEFQTFFTPNEDGHFDTWNILNSGSDYFKSIKVKIFDRYGKLLKELTNESSGWNGIYNGKPLPSNDYWYTAKLVYKNGKVLNKTGHFALLRK